MSEKMKYSLKNFFIGILTNLYLLLRNFFQRISRNFRLSMGYKITLRYLKGLSIALFLSTVFINTAVCLFLFIDEWKKLCNSQSGIGEWYDLLQQFKWEDFLFLIQKTEIALHNLKINWGDFIFEFFIVTVISQLIALSIAFARGAKTNWQTLKPIEKMSQTAKKISGENLSLRINIHGIQDELKELAQTINDMMDRIETAYIKQQQFVSDASHELRTPIAVIRGYASMLDRWGKNDPQVLDESVMAIKNESHNMQELVEKLLFIARSGGQGAIMTEEEFDLSMLLSEIVKETQMIDSIHKISSNIANDIRYLGDKNRIKQALRIFVNNSVNYTPEEGSISVRAFVEKQDVVITIKDSGIGIPDEDIRFIFDRFYRSEKSRTKAKGGHGLGLAIAKIIILGHKGKIVVRSKVGKWTEFTIFLPIH